MSHANNSDPRLEGAQRAATDGDLPLAEQLLSLVLKDDPSSLVALDLLGFVLYFQDRPVEAEHACRRAIALDPRRAYSNKGLGLCLAKQGKVEQGLPFIHEAIRLEPQWFDPRWDLAIVLMDAERYAEALEVLDEAATALPDCAHRLNVLRSEICRRSGAAQEPAS